MTDEQDKKELIDNSATRYAVPPGVLTSLLSLERDFENFSSIGAKAEFSRQVARILDEASAKPV